MTEVRMVCVGASNHT